MKELDITAIPENLNTVLEFIDSHLEQTGCSMKIQMQIDLAVEEIFVNIAHYAYQPDIGPATVRVEVKPDGSAVTITFIDQGVPFDPLAREDPDVTLSSEQRGIGGLGVFLVKQNMDNIQYEYENGSNILTMKKDL